MSTCVYELKLEPDEIFQFYFEPSNNKIMPLKSGELKDRDFLRCVNLVTQTLKVASCDVDKYIFDLLHRLKEPVDLINENQNIFVIKKVLDNNITEVTAFAQKGCGSNISYYYISMLNAPLF